MPPSPSVRRRATEVLGVDPDVPLTAGGYVDLLGDAPPPAGLAQRLMTSRAVPAIYERWWRPALGRAVKGPLGPSMAGEVRLARRLLAIPAGATVVDVACGTGRFTRAFADDAGAGGAVVGLDVSATMLERAAAATAAEQVVFVRGDITALPVREAEVDAVCCFAALHLFDDPWAALDAMSRALVPGGRLAILTSIRPRVGPVAAVAEAAGAATGVRIFSPEELTGALAGRGLQPTETRRLGLMQALGARRPHGIVQ